MPVADELRPACPGGAVGGDERDGINLELGQRIGRDVGSGAGCGDVRAVAQQQPASLARGCRGRFGQDCGQNATCQSDSHPHLPAIMGDTETIVQGVIAQDGQRLDKALADASGLSRERIKALLGEGRITLGGKAVAHASMKPAAGTAFAISVPAAVPAEAAAQDIPLTIVYEDADLVVVDKPAGLVVHPAAGNLDGTLVNALLHHCRGQLSGIGGVARPGIVHRIDKDTSGLLVVAKHDAAHEGLARQFADHSIERAYMAVTSGTPKPMKGTVRGDIARSSANRTKMALVEDGRGRHAVTHYETLERFDSAALVECRLETGRTHQVRVHLASIGHALLGDPVYGRSPARLKPLLQKLGFQRQALHAAVLGFKHPCTGEAVRFASELPADMRELLAELRAFR